MATPGPLQAQELPSWRTPGNYVFPPETMLDQELDALDDKDMQSTIQSLLKDPENKAKVAVALRKIREDARVRHRISMELLRALGALPEDDGGDDEERDDTQRGHSEQETRDHFLSPDVKPTTSTISSRSRQSLDTDISEEESDKARGSYISRTSRASDSTKAAGASRSNEPMDSIPFMSWTRMARHELGAMRNFGMERRDLVLSTYEGVNFNVGGGGITVGLDNFLKMVRSWFFSG